MRNKGGSSFFSFIDRNPRLSSHGMALFLIIALLGAGIWVSPAVAAYVDNFSGGNVILAVPVAVDDAYTVNEDTDLVVLAVDGVLFNDSDADLDTLTAVLDSDVSNGTLLLDPDGSINYAPDLDFTGSDSFTYHASDGTNDSNSATVTITVDPVNDAPLGKEKSIRIDEDQSYTLQDIDFGFTDPIDDPTPNSFLAVKITSLPVEGVLKLNNTPVALNQFVPVGSLPTLVFTPAANVNGDGVSGFTFKVQDDGGNGGVDLDPNPNTITFDINPINDPPVADPQTVSTSEDASLPILLSGTDVDGDNLTFNAPSTTTHGTLTGTAPGLTYHPASNYTGPDSFTFTVNDGTVNSLSATISITVNALNDPPVLNSIGNKTIAELANLTFSATGSDPEAPPQTLTFSLTSAPGGASIGSSGGIFNWTPTEAQGPGVYPFSVCISDGTLDTCEAITVTVSEVNVAPVLAAIGIQNVDETLPLSFSAGASDADLPAQTLTFSLGGAPAGAAITAGGAFTWTPSESQGGASYPVTIQVTDGALTDSETFNVTVADTNVPPVAVTDNLSTPEDTPDFAIQGDPTLLGNDTDVDDPPQTLSIVGLGTGGGSPVGGSVTYNSNQGAGRFHFIPTANFAGSASFTYRMTDGIAQVDGTVNIDVTAVNDVPVATPQSVNTNEDTQLGIVLSGSDVEGSTLTYNAPATTLHGTLTGTAPILTYHPALNYNGPDSFAFTAFDGTATSAPATISITVNALNDAPVALPDTFSTTEETPLTVGAPGVLSNDSDPDGDPLTAIPDGSATGGSVNLSTDGGYTFTPAPNFTGAASFSYHASDGVLNSNIVSVTINVSNVNDAPVLTTISPQSGPEMVNLTFTAVATDVDPPPQPLTFSLGGTPPIGASIDALTGVFSWIPTEAQGPFSNNIEVCVSDGVAPLQCQLVSVTISEVNLPPVGNDDVIPVLEDSSANIMAVLANDTDPDLPPNTLTWTGVTPNPGPKGVLGLGTNITYTPNANVNGSDGFTYSVFDGSLSDPAAVTINILSVNDAPIGVPNTKNINEDNLYTFAAADFAFTDVNDSPANTLLGVKITTLPALGVLKLSNVAVTTGQVIPAASLPNLTFTPALNGNGAPYTSFTFLVQDNGGVLNGGIDLDPTPRSFTFNVAAVADAPSGVADAYTFNTFSTLPFTVAAPGVLANDSDGDTFANWTLSVLTQPTNGTVVLSQNGSFTYTQTGTPPLVYEDTFVYRITDTTPATTVDVTVTLTVDLTKPTQVAKWVLPVTNGQPYIGSTETVELQVSLDSLTDVNRVEFWYWDHTALTPHWVFIAADTTATPSGGLFYFSALMSMNVLPVATNIQLFARTYDANGNYTDRDLTLPDPYKYAWILVTHKGTVFLPLIMK